MTDLARENASYFDNCQARYPGVVGPFACFHRAGSLSVNESKDQHTTTYQVEATDSISAAKSLKLQGLRPLVLNFASEFKAGGGYWKGSIAQEESLFYASTYALALDPRFNPKTKAFYPIPKDAAIYTPNVLVIRDEDLKLLNWKDCYLLDFVACPALRNPKLQKGLLSAEDAETTRLKMRLVFDIALTYSHDSLVLGAWGSGVFGNPPDQMARLFMDVLREPRYVDRFRAVTFAVLVAKSKDRPNLVAYQEVVHSSR